MNMKLHEEDVKMCKGLSLEMTVVVAEFLDRNSFQSDSCVF